MTHAWTPLGVLMFVLVLFFALGLLLKAFSTLNMENLVHANGQNSVHMSGGRLAGSFVEYIMDDFCSNPLPVPGIGSEKVLAIPATRVSPIRNAMYAFVDAALRSNTAAVRTHSVGIYGMIVGRISDGQSWRHIPVTEGGMRSIAGAGEVTNQKVDVTRKQARERLDLALNIFISVLERGANTSSARNFVSSVREFSTHVIARFLDAVFVDGQTIIDVRELNARVKAITAGTCSPRTRVFLTAAGTKAGSILGHAFFHAIFPPARNRVSG